MRMEVGRSHRVRRMTRPGGTPLAFPLDRAGSRRSPGVPKTMTDLKLVPPRRSAASRPPAPRRAGREHFSALTRPRLRTLAVASGKGGVGKSTVLVNLATALGEMGARVVL